MKLLISPPVRSDAAGSGYYGARRGKHTHTGLDLEMAPGSIIVAPERGRIGRYGNAYSSDPRWRIVDFHGMATGLHYRFFYAVSCRHNLHDVVEQGEPIAVAQDIRQRYPGQGMVPHVHVEILLDGERVDPEKYLL